MHKRKFVFSCIDMVKIRFLTTRKISIYVQNYIEALIINSDFLVDAPFSWVGLTYRYGIANKLKPQYERIDKTDGELPLTIELDSNILKWSDNNYPELFKEIFIIAALDALIDTGNKYKLSMDFILQEKFARGDIPKTIEECEQRLKSFTNKVQKHLDS